MENQFQKFNITNYKRVPAVNGADITQPIDKFTENPNYTVQNINFWNNYTNLKHNELACTLSHLNTIRTAYQDGLEMVLILEDDASIQLIPYWRKTFDQYIAEFPPDWYCVSLFNMACYINNNLPEYINVRDKICNGSVAYVINRKGMKNILNTMNLNLLVMDKYDPQNHNVNSRLTSLS